MNSVKFLKRNFLQRVLGIPATPRPADPGCWTYEAGKLVVDLNRAPELQESGGALRFEGGGLPDRVLVVRSKEGFLAYRNRCTHVGHRRLDPVAGTGTVQCCSVGRSTYDAEGRPVFGPAPRPIVVYPAAMKDGQLFIDVF